LADLDYILFYPEPKSPGSGFWTGLMRLISALDTDLDWLREHTRLLLRATEWDAGGRAENLSGSDVTAAKAWAARRPKNAPEPTSLHFDFIRTSEDAQAARDNAQRKQLAEIATAQARTARLQRRAQWGLALIAELVLTAIAIVAWQYGANLKLQASLSKSERALQDGRELFRRQQANFFNHLGSVFTEAGIRSAPTATLVSRADAEDV
jgi:hypothetical protein